MVLATDTDSTASAAMAQLLLASALDKALAHDYEETSYRKPVRFFSPEMHL